MIEIIIVGAVLINILVLGWIFIDSYFQSKGNKFGIFIIYVIVLLLIFYKLFLGLINLRDFQFFGTIKTHIYTDQKLVALSFDDGPTYQTTELLNMLSGHNIKATFFLIGTHIQENPIWAQQIYQAGHQIGNHSYSHQRIVFKNLDFVQEELSKTNKLIRDSGYTGDIYFRSPYGKKFLTLPRALSKINMTNILWSTEPDFYTSPTVSTNQIKEYADSIKPGDIVLMHPWYYNYQTRQALPFFIQYLKDRGFKFVRVDELLRQ